jgi:arabinofuranan 3-O-arabinosyltransferase
LRHAAGQRARRLTERWPLAVLAGVCYIPLLFTAPGEVGADTKTYLYQDPGRLLSRAASMWDPNVGLGTVTHQNIGYLFPMGPYYWLTEKLDLPMWVAQRIWLGSLLFFAGAGVWFLLRTLRWSPLPATVAAFAYALTPYTLTLEARLSGILLPFTGLPWMIAFTIRAIRRGGWREPALFALVILVVGQINATGLIYAGMGPLLWFPYAVWVTKEAPWRRAAGAFGRIGLLTVLTSLWWIAGLSLQGGYGIDVLKYTETAKVVASAAVAPEVLRGLGYWFFYGGDRLGPWIEPGVAYTQRLWLIVVSYLTPVFALLGAAMSRWKHRAYFATLAAVGLFIAVGAHPWDDPPLTGRWWQALLESDRGLAMRSTPRAIPLVVLGLAVLLSAGIATLIRSAPRAAVPAGVAALALVLAGLPPLYTGDMVAANLNRPEQIPQYWLDAAASLDAQSHSTRVFEVPGTDFASYRWGNTVDPITPGLMDRPYVARELIPYGSAPSADLLNAFDRRLQENTLDPQAVAPIARLLGVGQIVARNDLQYERYRIARPYDVMALLHASDGLTPTATFGPPSINHPSPIAPMNDEAALRDDKGTPYTPVAVFTVGGQQTIIRTADAQQPVVVSGDGEGLLALAAAGLLDGSELVQYSASYAGNPDGLNALLARDAALVLTDSNRRQGRRWSTLRDNLGYTEQAGEQPLREDLTDNRLPVFASAGDDAYTVTQYPGGVSARATSYGNPISYTPEFRPANAVDGDPRTSWRTGASTDVRGEELRLDFAAPVDTDHITVTQVLSGFRNRTITALDLRFDGHDTVHVDLGSASNLPAGQLITFPQRTFSTLELIIRGDDSGRVAEPGRPVRYNGLTEVGFTEVDVDGRRGGEIVRLPTDLLAAAGQSSLAHPLTLVLERKRVDPAETVRDDEELSIVRSWTQPTARTFAFGGAARVSAHVDDATIDLLLGVIGPTATSTRRLPGDLSARASSAIDGNPLTAWTPAFEIAGDDAVTYQIGRPITFSHLDLRVLADGRHSVPTHLRIEADGQLAANVTVPAITDTPGARGFDGTVRVPIDLPEPVTGSTISVVVDGVREITTTDWFPNGPIRMPIGIAELGIEGLEAVAPTSAFDSGCRTDLLTVDGQAIGVEITGLMADAQAGQPLTVVPCGSNDADLVLGPGEHVLRATKGVDSGFNLDRLVLQSAASGGAPPQITAPGGGHGTGPTLQIDHQGRTDADLTITNPTPGTPFWVVLGQSFNDGWTATADGHGLGPPQLVDGYANGWLVSTPAATVHVHLNWAPQRRVWIALALSALGVVLCLVLVVRRPRTHPLAVDDPQPEPIGWRTFARSRGRDEPSVWITLLVSVGSGLIAAAVIGIGAGLVTALVAGTATRRRRARWWLALGSPGLLAVCALYIVGRQARSKPTAAFEWPAEQAAVHQVGWLAIVFLLLLVVVDAIWDRVNRHSEMVADAAASSPPDDAWHPSDDAWPLP